MDGSGLSLNRKIRTRFTVGVGANGQRQTISLTGSAFTSLTVPSGSKLVMLFLDGAISLVLKGITGDSGITLAPSTNPIGVDALIPLGASPTIGILNNSTSTQVIEICFL